jgi:hypothetical protein
MLSGVVKTVLTKAISQNWTISETADFINKIIDNLEWDQKVTTLDLLGYSKDMANQRDNLYGVKNQIFFSGRRGKLKPQNLHGRFFLPEGVGGAPYPSCVKNFFCQEFFLIKKRLTVFNFLICCCRHES